MLKKSPILYNILQDSVLKLLLRLIDIKLYALQVNPESISRCMIMVV